MRQTTLGVTLMIGVILSAGCSVFGIRTEETPSYDVVVKSNKKEIRRYQPFVVAKTTIKGDYKRAQSEGFRRLAGYIFGDNVAKKKLAMTAPVTQTPKSEKLEMTAPVTQEATDDGWTMTFVMPSEYTIADLPTPNDKRVTFETVPSREVAAIRYSWGRSEARNAEKRAELEAWLSSLKSHETAQNATYAGYDPPWTLPFFRRHEILVPVNPVNRRKSSE